ncbi:hypothetical protein HY091_02630 [Candidatus Kaiserbacteria bacterium]|nr:hypothetical protein [Candidatus Kaiserbacteria bacterium]
MRSLFTALFILGILGLSVPAHAEDPALNLGIGIKSENLRFGGGKVISKDAILASDGIAIYSSGFYVREWGTNGEWRDNETDLGIGLKHDCFGGLTCRLDASYWILPRNDLINLTFELSHKYQLDPGETIGWSLQAEDLSHLHGGDTQILRMIGSYGRSIAGIPVQLSGGTIYDYDPQHWHAVATLSAPIPLGETGSMKWSLTPSIETVIPLNDRAARSDGLAFGLRLGVTTP